MMEESLAKLIRKNDVQGQIEKLLIERAKGQNGEATLMRSMPRVYNGDFQDAEVLFGKENETEVTLRKDKHLGKEIIILQFDPYFKSVDVPCRHPSCKNKNFKAAKRGQGKRDLYLCCDHRDELKSRICQAFEKEKIEFSKYQSGFRPLHSTLTALIDITDNWYLNIDDGLTNAILFIDLKKAFDAIDHEILLSKLELYGFKGTSLNLFSDYLSDRTQVTVTNNVNSETSFISCGVPQGSILGPLLFLLCINDLPNCNLLSDVRMYADDTNLTFASKDPNELFSSLTHDLGNLKQWLDSNRLSLNVLKTKCLHFTGTRQKISLLPSEPHICLDGHSIERVNSYKLIWFYQLG